MKSKLPYRRLFLALVVFLSGCAVHRWLLDPPPDRIPGPRYLIVNADDLGLSEGVNEGIVQAWQEGFVTSTSALINIEGAPEQVAAIHAAYPDLPIGLHLNLTLGRPVLSPDRVPSLVDENGTFYSREVIAEFLAEMSPDEVRAELNAQAELLIASGVQFDHIDYHEGMLVFYTPFFSLVREMASKYDVPLRQPAAASIFGQVKLPGGGALEMFAYGLQHPKLGITLLPHMTPDAFKAKADSLDAEGIAAPNWFIDAYLLNGSVDNFISILKQLPPGVSEVPVHPGLVDEKLQELGGGYVEPRQTELAVLLDPRVRAALAEYNVQLVDFSFFQLQRR